MSEASRARAPRAPECPNDHAPTKMAPAVLRVHFPHGTLPVEGFKCPKCGEETIPADVVARTQKQAHALGLFGVEQKTRRKLVENGSSLAVTLDAQLLEDVFGYRPEKGEEVVVGRQGAAIVVERSEPTHASNRKRK